MSIETSKTEEKKKDWKDIEYQTTLGQVQKAWHVLNGRSRCRREIGTGEIFEVIISENFPHLCQTPEPQTKRSQREKAATHIGTKIRIISNVSLETMQTRGEWSES